MKVKEFVAIEFGKQKSCTFAASLEQVHYLTSVGADALVYGREVMNYLCPI